MRLSKLQDNETIFMTINWQFGSEDYKRRDIRNGLSFMNFVIKSSILCMKLL